MTISWTVVLPTVNRPAMLKRAIESSIAQAQPCEIVVVDDHSSDETPAVVAQFPQIIYLRNDKNLGHSASVNLGIERASGSWIKHLDDDDFLHPDCLRKMTQGILAARSRGHDPKIVTSVACNVDVDEKPLAHTRTLPIDRPAIMKRADLLPMMMCDQAPLGTPVQVAHERRAALDVGGWNVDRPVQFRNGDETECWIRLASQGDALFLPEVLSYRTLWFGNEAPPHRAQCSISRYLKERIFEQMDGRSKARIPTEIAHYLNLHWGLIALRDRKALTGLKLVLGGMFDPRSYGYIRRRSRFTDAMKVVYLLT